MTEDVDVQAEADEMIEILDGIEKIQKMPDEKFYPINREARRRAERRDRATRKRDPRGQA